MHIYVYVYTFTYMCIYMYKYIYSIYAYTSIYIYTCIYICIYMYIRIYVYKYIHIYIYSYIHTYMRTYTHTCTYVGPLFGRTESFSATESMLTQKDHKLGVFAHQLKTQKEKAALVRFYSCMLHMCVCENWSTTTLTI